MSSECKNINQRAYNSHYDGTCAISRVLTTRSVQCLSWVFATQERKKETTTAWRLSTFGCNYYNSDNRWRRSPLYWRTGTMNTQIQNPGARRRDLHHRGQGPKSVTCGLKPVDSTIHGRTKLDLLAWIRRVCGFFFILRVFIKD